MRLRGAMYWAAAAAVSGLVLLGWNGATAASAATGHCVPWSDQADMSNAAPAYCRSTFVDDPGAGHLLTRANLLGLGSGQANTPKLYADNGFDEQWMWYAPQATMAFTAGSAQQWTACPAGAAHENGGPCPLAETLKHGPIVGDFSSLPVHLDVLAFGGRFVTLVCGNFSYPVTSHTDPAPVIDGHEFNDLNRNGILDPGEPGISGFTFQLIRDSSTYSDQAAGYVTSTTSDASGNFSFPLRGIGPGTYTVKEIAPDGWDSTTGRSQTVVVHPGIGNVTVASLRFGDRADTPPVADAGPAQYLDQASAAGTPVTLDGTGSYDHDGDRLSYTWTGPFGTATGATPTVSLPAGTSTVHLTVSDGTSTSTASSSITVYPPITAAGSAIAPTEGTPFTGTVATFTDPDPHGDAADYAATIDWGDGTPPTTATITKGTDGKFSVSGSHTYADESSYQPSITITDPDTRFNTATVTATARVADAPLTASGTSTPSTNPVNAQIATFTDANPAATSTDFSATIDWGDGTTPTAGTISGEPGGLFTVTGSHPYSTLGPKTITVTIVDDGGSRATAVSHILLYALPSGGDFVIGNGNFTAGNSVTFWGARWSTLNTLSGGPAPASFKGFETSTGSSTTATTWTTRPGNSPNPPATIPNYMAVIVSSTITKTGSVISGDAPHVVIVKTDTGYQDNPGHPGTGTVIAKLR
jgi:hypothetical protein